MAFTGLLRPRMRGHEFVGGRVDAHGPAAPTHMEVLPDQAEGGGIVGVVEGQMAIAVERDQLPRRHVVRRLRQRPELGLLGLLKAAEGWLARGAMDARSGGGQTPLPDLLVGLCDQRRRAATEEIARDVMHATLLDLALVLGRTRAAGGDQEAVVFGALAIGVLHLRVIPGRLGNAGFEIVDHQTLRHAAKKLEGMAVQEQPGADFLVKDELDILVATPGQRHDKGPGFAEGARSGIDHAASGTEVHLGFLGRCPLDAHDDIGGVVVEGADKAVDGRIAATEAPFFEALPNGGDLGALRAQLADEGAVGLDRGDDLRGWRELQGLINQPLELIDRR